MTLPDLFRRKATLDAGARARLAAWRRLPDRDGRAGLESARFVVVDVETTGLSLARDRLIAIGAVAVDAGRIDLGDSFEAVLRQETVSGKENILIHGIGGTAQREGVPPVEALLGFLEYLGKDPLIAFHVAFDEIMIRRALKAHLGHNFRHRWLDLAYALPALYPELAKECRSLDEWAGHFGIRNLFRHNALADSLATAELFLIALNKARQAGLRQFRELRELEKAQRWVSGAG
jgi:DNA polymerase-3 subunit epsilon